MLSCTEKGHGFDSQSGYIPQLLVQSADRAQKGGKSQCFSHVDVSSSPCISLSPSLSLESIGIPSGEDWDKKQRIKIRLELNDIENKKYSKN